MFLFFSLSSLAGRQWPGLLCSTTVSVGLSAPSFVIPTYSRQSRQANTSCEMLFWLRYTDIISAPRAALSSWMFVEVQARALTLPPCAWMCVSLCGGLRLGPSSEARWSAPTELMELWSTSKWAGWNQLGPQRLQTLGLCAAHHWAAALMAARFCCCEPNATVGNVTPLWPALISAPLSSSGALCPASASAVGLQFITFIIH